MPTAEIILRVHSTRQRTFNRSKRLSTDVFRTPKRSETVVILGYGLVSHWLGSKSYNSRITLLGQYHITVIYTFSHFRKTKAKKSISYKPLPQNMQNLTLCFVKWIKISQLFITARGAKWLISRNAISMSHAQTPTCQTFVIATPVPLVTALTGGHL
jgi:hypothetical protein